MDDVLQHDARAAFDSATEAPWWKGIRVKAIRHEVLQPGGRCRLQLFAAGEDEGRAHPRFTVSMPPVDMGEWPVVLPVQPAESSIAAWEAWIERAWAETAPSLLADVVQVPGPPGSERYFANSIRTQRTAAFFAAARERGLAGVEPSSRNLWLYAVRRLEDEAYAGAIPFDDADTGTYHSFGHDEPFVHYLEVLLRTLPIEGSAEWQLLSDDQKSAILRQKRGCQAHLDWLMRHKYAYHSVIETDIERSVGGFLIDRNLRARVSETEGSQHAVLPTYECLTILADSAHAYAGARVVRDAQGLCLYDGTRVVVPDEMLERQPVLSSQLTFARAPNDPHLRAGVRLDWDNNGWLSPNEISWVGWAGHCDIKAILEQLGLTLTGDAPLPQLLEYRSDTGETTRYTRDLLLEMLASVVELGSVYRTADGTQRVRRGQSLFGGARNDSRPDRLQFRGQRAGQGLRWPLSERAGSLTVRSIEKDGAVVPLGRAFGRWIPCSDRLDFEPNPLFEKTIEGDVSLLDVSGCRVGCTILEDVYDSAGYLTTRPLNIDIDLRSDNHGEAIFLGAQTRDLSDRSVWKVWLDVQSGRVEGRVFQTVRDADGQWTEQARPEQDVVLQLALPITLTVSRETKRDDPAMFQTLLQRALRSGQNICADTDMKAEVWNGVVVRIDAQKLREDRSRRVEHWRFDLVARFGGASLEYLVRKDEMGEPIAWCPLDDEDSEQRQPDFLWQEFPDVGSKAWVNGRWMANEAMEDRGIISWAVRASENREKVIEDDHIKHVFEVIFSALSGRRFSVVHNNRRWIFDHEDDWKDAIDNLSALRERCLFGEIVADRT